MRESKVPLTSEKPLIISLFSGAGGLDLGFREEGYKIAVAIDYESSAIDTHKHNFQDTKCLVADLTKLGPVGVLKHVKANVPIQSRIGVIGGPPCQGFSRANISSQPDDPRNLLPVLYVDIIRELQKNYTVEFVIFENVLGMKDKKHAPKYAGLISGLQDLGLETTEKELCALDFGVPQNRNRIIVSAVRKDQGYLPVTPKPRHGLRTVKEAIGTLPLPVFFSRSLKSTDIPHHPNHWTMQPKSIKFTENIEVKSKARSFRKLKWDKASPTIAFGNREIHVHPDGTRRLSIYEAMLLQGFPPEFELKGNLSQQVKQISNAVPPPLARSLAAALKESIEKSAR
jgi:DNA (cytosine-5)-methyltransferase 1